MVDAAGKCCGRVQVERQDKARQGSFHSSSSLASNMLTLRSNPASRIAGPDKRQNMHIHYWICRRLQLVEGSSLHAKLLGYLVWALHGFTCRGGHVYYVSSTRL